MRAAAASRNFASGQPAVATSLSARHIRTVAPMSGRGPVTSSSGAGQDWGIITRTDGTQFLSPAWAKAFIGLLRAADSLARYLDDELQRDHQISLRGFEVLLFLAVFSSNGSLRLNQLTENAPLSQSRVSRLVAELTARGFVARGPDPEDARGVVVSITEAGREKFLQAQASHLRSLEERLFSRLTDREIRELARITEKLLTVPDDDPA